MKKKRIRPFLLACLLLAVLLVVPATGLADAGGFAGDSDYGGGSDWGGSSDWGSGSDWGSSSGDGFVIGNSDGSGTGSGGGLIFWIIVVVIIYFVIRAKGKKGGGNGAVNPGASRTVLPMTIAQLKEMDPNFSEEAMKEKIGNLYIRMQDCWQNKKWEEMRTGMTDALFNQMGSQLAALIRNKLRGLGEDKEAVKVTVDEPREDGTIVYHLSVAEGDMGRVIGKQGRIAKAIRVVMRAAAVRVDEKVLVEID